MGVSVPFVTSPEMSIYSPVEGESELELWRKKQEECDREEAQKAIKETHPHKGP